MLEPTGFVYVARFRCGHVNLLAVEPHPDDREERRSLMEDLRTIFVRGGTIERMPLDQMPPLELCECKRADDKRQGASDPQRAHRSDRP